MIIKIDYSNPKHSTYYKVDAKNKLYYQDNTWSGLTLTQSQLADIKSGNTIVFDGGKASLTDRFMSGGSTMEKRTKLGLSRDKMYKALGEGERTSKKVSTIRMPDGSSFKRRNANQHGMAEGGNDYTEKRSNRSDKFDNGGGTGVSSQTGYAEGTNAELLMNKDYLAYKNGGGVGDIKIDVDGFEGVIDEKNKTLTVFYNEDGWSNSKSYERDLKAAAKNKDDRMADNIDNALEKYEYVVDFNRNHVLDFPTDSITYHIIEKGKMKTGGGVGDDYTVTLETFEIDMPKFQTYLKSKNIKFKKHSNSVEVDYFGTYNSLKSMIDKYWAMDSDKDEKKEYYDLIEKTTKMSEGGLTKGFEYTIGGL